MRGCGRHCAGSERDRELALIKVAATPRTRSQVFELVEVFRARIVDLAPESMIIEMTGVESKIEGDPGAQRRRRAHSGDLPQRQADYAPRPSHQWRAEALNVARICRRRGCEVVDGPSRNIFSAVILSGAQRSRRIRVAFLQRNLILKKHFTTRKGKERKPWQKHFTITMPTYPDSGQEGRHIGYGSQGHAHALNLKDSGVEVKMACPLRNRTPSPRRRRRLDVIPPAEAAKWADVVILLAPDQIQARSGRKIEPEPGGGKL